MEEMTMSGCIKKVSKWSLPLLLIAAGTVGATSDELAKSVQLYYAGSPDQAISSIKPLALAGDAEAQLTLGNILYSLSKANQRIEFEDSIKWYEMAAAQDSADANSALGVIYHNEWLESRSREDAAMAISYYEKAIELGDKNAPGYLSKLRRRGRI
jgi:TPR repeat protein